MTREEAIAELREDKALYESDICHAGDGSPDGDLLEALDMAIEALSADAEWIPCSERLPSEDGSYLVTSSFGKVYTAHFYSEHGHWQHNRRGLIEAWMPLPKPYKGGDE